MKITGVCTFLKHRGENGRWVRINSIGLSNSIPVTVKIVQRVLYCQFSNVLPTAVYVVVKLIAA